MTDDTPKVRYVPLDHRAGHTEPPQRQPFDLSTLTVTGLVIMCELDAPPPGNSRPTMAMKMTQYLRLSDESMIRLDMDRGVATFKYGHTEPLSWKRPSADVITEVLTLIQGDEPEPGSFPWDEYSRAAQQRGITVEPNTLSALPYTVFISDELAATFEF